TVAMPSSTRVISSWITRSSCASMSPDCMRLRDDLDDVIDGMRKVAIHIDIYKTLVMPLWPGALELFAIGERMMLGVRELVANALGAEGVSRPRPRSGPPHR